MRNLIILFVALFAVMGIAVAQPTKMTPPNTELSGPYVPQGEAIFPFTTDNEGAWLHQKAITVTDILTSGEVKDTSTATVVFYGKIWALEQSDSLPHVQICGMDSVTITPYFRYLSFTTGAWAAGPWVAYGAATTLTTTRVPMVGGGGGRDTLVSVAKTMVSGAGPFARPGFCQFKYSVVSNRAIANGRSGAKQYATLTLANKALFNFTFLGAVNLLFRREAM